MEKEIKGIVSTILGALTALIGTLAIPVLLLVGCNIIDYVTGIIAAKYRDQAIDSYKGFRGIAKKVSMWLLVGVGAVMDWLLVYAAQTVGAGVTINFVVACVVAIWLICNETLSILENVADIGVPMPAFLGKIAKYVKAQAEQKGESVIPKEGTDDGKVEDK